MKLVGLGIATLSSMMWAGASLAQEPSGREHILQMAGCHDVTYYFHEDGERDSFANEKPPAIVTQELVSATEEKPERNVLQHATIGEGGKAIRIYTRSGPRAREVGRSPSTAVRQGLGRELRY